MYLCRRNMKNDMKNLFTVILLALVALTGQAKMKDVVWEQPTAFMGASNSTFEITKVELKETETVLHVTAICLYGWCKDQRERVRPAARLAVPDT